jgi:hypothetical protein
VEAQAAALLARASPRSLVAVAAVYRSEFVVACTPELAASAAAYKRASAESAAVQVVCTQVVPVVYTSPLAVVAVAKADWAQLVLACSSGRLMHRT